MKRLMIALGTLLMAVYLASLPALAQGRSGGAPGVSHRSSSNTTDSSTTQKGPQSASDMLTDHPKLSSALSNGLSKNNVLPSGTNLQEDCQNFRTLGQCISALHVARNRNITFACLAWDVTGVKPAGTGLDTSNCTAPTHKMSLGQAIQTLDPSANAKAEASKGIRQANADIKSAKS